VRLFRQDESRDYSAVAMRVLAALEAEISGFKP
jgi:hypothetical protein